MNAAVRPAAFPLQLDISSSADSLRREACRLQHGSGPYDYEFGAALREVITGLEEIASRNSALG